MRFNFKSILIIVILLIGLVGGVYLVQFPQILKSKASAKAFQVNNLDGIPIERNEDGSFTTGADRVKIKVLDINELDPYAE